MAQYVVFFLLSSLVMSVIILAILAFNTLFPKIFTAKLRYTVWLIVLIGLIIPLRPVIGGGLVAVPLPTAAQTQLDEANNFPISKTVPETNSMQRVEITESAATDNNTVSPIMICALVWGMVAVLIFSYHIWRYLRFVRMIRRWGVQVKDEEILSVLQTVIIETELSGKRIDLRICGFVSSSMLTGFIRPVILLPDKHFDEDELELIFKHELIHYKRHDLLIKLLSVIVISIHWFNPFVYLMYTAMQTDGEASCDEAVLWNADKENRQFYAEVIIGMIGSKNTTRTMLSTCFYGGKLRIKKRLDCIMDTTRKIKKPAALILIAVAVLTLLSGSVFALAQIPPDAQASTIPEAAAPTEISMEQAENIALATVGGGTITYCEKGFEGDRVVYKTTIIYGDKRYIMDIDAISSNLMNYQAEEIGQIQVTILPDTQMPSDKQTPQDTPLPATNDDPVSLTSSATEKPTPAAPQETLSEPSTPTATEITAEQAKEIAIAETGGGTVTECKRDYENGRKVYEIKIVNDNAKYEMDVDAITGAVSDYSEETIKTDRNRHHDDHDD